MGACWTEWRVWEVAPAPGYSSVTPLCSCYRYGTLLSVRAAQLARGYRMPEDKDKDSLGKEEWRDCIYFTAIYFSCFVLSLIIIHPAWLFPHENLGYSWKTPSHPQCSCHHSQCRKAEIDMTCICDAKSKMLGVHLLLDGEARQTSTSSGFPLLNAVRGCRTLLPPGMKHSVSAVLRDIV